MKKEKKPLEFIYFSAIEKAGDNFETLYNFCGEYDKLLIDDYKEQKIKEQGVSFPQFCIVVFSNLLEKNSSVLQNKKK
jgi:hypothetical protein